MATLTEFTNLAEISTGNGDTEYSTKNTNSNVVKGYIKVSKKDSLSSEDDPAVLPINTSDVRGTSISFRNLVYSVEAKIKRKRTKRNIVKGIR